MPKIFISYRREDSQHQADRLHAALKKHVADPKRDIFIDVGNVPVGVDFVEHVDRQMAQCDVLLALIGPDWLNALNPRTGKRRLDDPKDFVRVEIGSALKRDIPVAPVLLDGATFPSEDELPDDLKPLARRNGAEVRRLSFEADAERMIAGLGLNARSADPEPSSARQRPRWIYASMAFAPILVVIAGLWFVDSLGPKSKPTVPSVLPAPSKVVQGRVFRDVLFGGGEGPQMVEIPAGSFVMGSASKELAHESDEEPQHIVRIGYEFAVGRFEVTWAEWDACVADGGCPALKDDGFGKGEHPVTNVAWNEGRVYGAWLSKKTGHKYRLLTESEWEYVARAGTVTPYAFGDSISIKDANFDGSIGKTTPAGQFAPNAFGLYDMHGNVLEWVEDCYAPSYSAGQPWDGRPWTAGTCEYRVTRGGAWNLVKTYVRSATRSSSTETTRFNRLGFRLARTR